MTITSGSPTNNYLAMFSGTCNIENSGIFQTGTGNIGIGTITPGTRLGVRGVNTLDSDARFNIQSFDTTSAAAGTGGGISFAGYYSGTSLQAALANIRGVKENGTQGDFASVMIFDTRINGGNQTERMRISSAGNVGIGNATPLAKLDITGGMNASGSVVIGGTATKQDTHGPEKLSVQDADALKVAVAAFVGSEANARLLLDMNGNHEWSSDGNDQTVVLGCTAIGRMNLVGFPLGSSARGGLGIVAWKWSTLYPMGVDSTTPTFPVQNTAPFTGVTRIRVDNEICDITGIDPVAMTLTVSRHQEGTMAASHSVNAPVVAIGTQEPQPRLLFLNDGGGIFFSDGTGYPDISVSRPFNSVLNATATLKLRPTSTFTAAGTVSISSMTPTLVTGDANTEFLAQVRVGDNIQVSGQTRTVTAVTNDSSLTVGTAFTVTGTGLFMTVLSFDATGTVSISNSTAVAGTGTFFTTEVGLGDRITINGQTQTVVGIPSDTSLTVGAAFTGMQSGFIMAVLPSIFRADDTSGMPRLIVSDQGSVGIGTAAPQALLDVAGQARVKPVTVATLPAPVAALQGAVACVTDATATTYYSMVAGGGSNVVMVFCDGTFWRIF